MRRPLPLFSASEPSGFRMRSAKAPAGASAAPSSTRMPSEPTPKCRSQIRRAQCRQVAASEIAALDDDVVVAQALVLVKGEAHGVRTSISTEHRR